MLGYGEATVCERAALRDAHGTHALQKTGEFPKSFNVLRRDAIRIEMHNIIPNNSDGIELFAEDGAVQ